MKPDSRFFKDGTISYNDKSSVPNIGCMEGLQINCYRLFTSLENVPQKDYIFIHFQLLSTRQPKSKDTITCHCNLRFSGQETESVSALDKVMGHLHV